MLGPAYTLGSTGNALQAGASYGSNKAITKYKKVFQKELEEKLKKKEKDIELQSFLKVRIAETQKKIKIIK